MAPSPVIVVLSEVERAELVGWLVPSAQARHQLRARIVLAAARGDPNARVAHDLGS